MKLPVQENLLGKIKIKIQKNNKNKKKHFSYKIKTNLTWQMKSKIVVNYKLNKLTH